MGIEPQTADSRQAVPRSVYVHIPFCRHRCGYCNFTLVAGRDHLIDSYLDALEKEMTAIGDRKSVDTIFIGGGTPTHLPLAQTSRLLELIEQRFSISAGGEVSVEANPQDIDLPKAQLLAMHGVNRISIGAQSFHTAKLRLLERDHDATQIRRAVEIARDLFRSVSLDLIFATPDESLASWCEDVRQAIELKVHHVSTYGLTIEKGTQFWNRASHGKLSELDEDRAADMYERSIDMLRQADFNHYEVSNFAREGHHSQHNQAYWTGKPFHGFGAGAASYLNGRRAVNHRSTTTYIKRLLAGESPIAESETLAPEASARERLVFGLRRLKGISLQAFQQETGFSVDALAGGKIGHFVEQNLLHRDSDTLRLTHKGLLISDSLWPELL